MSNSANGKVIDENGAGVVGLGVQLDDMSQVLLVTLATGTTATDGSFSLTYADYQSSDGPGMQPRQLRLRILVGLHPIAEVIRADSPQTTLTFDTIQRPAAEATSWWATLGSSTGAPSRMTRSNAVRWLVDNVDAWGHIQDVISNAKTLDIMQLSIAVDDYFPDFHVEKPQIVLAFDPNAPLDSLHRRNLTPNDKRIERSILEQVKKGVDVRIQIPRMSIDVDAAAKVVGLALLADALTGVAGLVLLGGIVGTLVGIVLLFVSAVLFVAIGIAVYYAATSGVPDIFNEKQLASYFANAVADLQAGSQGNPPATGLGNIRVSELKMRANNVTHAKVVIDRGIEAVVLGSPFAQVYYNDPTHLFDDLRRGGEASKGPIHDMSVAVRGGAVGYFEELFDNHWNIATPDDTLPVTPTLPSAPASLEDGEFFADVQVVRTLDQMFAPATAGEQGVLEAYLRAIHLAERFIYIENQYFNNDTITEALVAALKKNTALQLILLVNAAPDMPLYMGWQQKAIKRILGSFPNATEASKRVGVFSAWVHASKESQGQSNPAILDMYLHTKSALIDNRWATVGSANLDGASLDYVQYARAFFDSDVRNTEANLVVFEETAPAVSAVDALRRRLWSEHLGISDPADPVLDDAPGKDWVAAWRSKAANKLAKIKADFDNVDPAHILEWPTDDFFDSVGITKRQNEHATATKYLQSVLKPTTVPTADVAASGPDSFTFTYGAFPSTGVPG
jgi:phosphatidylserine/phosphatidylglycerophosphate/cardiolipin synthase-like enzyme